MLVDSHCHIPMIEGEEGTDAIVANALEHGVGHMLCVSVEQEDYPVLLDLAERYECISASIGIHPNTEMNGEVDVPHLMENAADPRVVAVGETGLDYFRSRGDLEWQRDRFRTHIRAAREIGKPIIIHCREAKDDVIAILEEEKADAVGGVMHCFVEDMDTARKAMDLNFLISFSGIVTFKNAMELKEIARCVPLDSMLVETDSPYLAPMPYRGKQNQPAWVRYVAEHIAELRDMPLDDFAAATTANFNRVFRPARPVP